MALTVDELWVGDDPEAWREAGFTVDADGTCRIGTVRVRLTGAAGPRHLHGWSLRGVEGPVTDVDGVPTTASTTDPNGSTTEPAGSTTDPTETTDRADPADTTASTTNPIDTIDTTDQADPNGSTTEPTDTTELADAAGHPNGVTDIDHVVMTTPDVERTVAALATLGLEPRRVRDDAERYPQPMRQTFFRLGEVVLELIGPQVTDPATAGRPARLWGIALDAADLDATAERLGPERLTAPKPAVQPGRRIATLRTRELGISTAIAFMTPATRGPTG